LALTAGASPALAMKVATMQKMVMLCRSRFMASSVGLLAESIVSNV
jgi:hypothetical protein